MPIMNFEQWFTSLTSDTRWVELLRHYKDDTIKKAGERVFAELVTRKIEDVKPMEENRIHVLNVLRKGPEDAPKPKPWYVQEAEKKEAEEQKQKEAEWVPLTGEQRAQKLKEWEAIVKGATIQSAVPRISYKELAEEGGVLPPKPAPYPTTSPMEAYMKERHISYLLNNYDPRTKEPLPLWQSETDFNLEYDVENYERYFAKFKNHLTDKGS